MIKIGDFFYTPDHHRFNIAAKHNDREAIWYNYVFGGGNWPDDPAYDYDTPTAFRWRLDRATVIVITRTQRI